MFCPHRAIQGSPGVTEKADPIVVIRWIFTHSLFSHLRHHYRVTISSRSKFARDGQWEEVPERAFGRKIWSSNCVSLVLGWRHLRRNSFTRDEQTNKTKDAAAFLLDANFPAFSHTSSHVSFCSIMFEDFTFFFSLIFSLLEFLLSSHSMLLLALSSTLSENDTTGDIEVEWKKKYQVNVFVWLLSATSCNVAGSLWCI